MRTFHIEVFADGRPVLITPEIVTASNHGVALRRGYGIGKPNMRNGVKTITVRATRLKEAGKGDGV